MDLLPVLGYAAYIFSFPCISYVLSNYKNKYASTKNATTLLNIALFSAFSLAFLFWMHLIGSRVYTFVYPILAIGGIIPIMKLAAYELKCLKPEETTHINTTFWNYYLYLVAPSEVSFTSKLDVGARTQERLKSGFAHALALYVFNKIVIFMSISQYSTLVRGTAAAFQLALCFGAMGDLSLAAFGLFTHDVFLEDLFRQPYYAESPREFWSKRWNLVVHKCALKLLYIPLGGSSNKKFSMPLIFLIVGVVHEIPMIFLPSARFGWWTAIFVLHIFAVFAQMAFEQTWPHLTKNSPYTRNTLRIGTLALLAYTSDMAYYAFGMTVEGMAADFNTIIYLAVSTTFSLVALSASLALPVLRSLLPAIALLCAEAHLWRRAVPIPAPKPAPPPAVEPLAAGGSSM